MLVDLSGVGRTYGTGEETIHALRDVDFQVQARAFTVVAGQSGSGKTTLLNLIGCLDRQSTGRAVVCGQDIAAMDARELADFRATHIGFIFQNFSLIPVLSVFENVEYPLMLLGQPAQARRQAVMAMLEAVGLEGLHARLPNQLSGGQKQRVAIARALIKRPALVLADEPTANLDSQTGQSIIQLMRAMQRDTQTTFIFSSHDPLLISSADAVVEMKDGRCHRSENSHA